MPAIETTPFITFVSLFCGCCEMHGSDANEGLYNMNVGKKFR